LKMVISVAKSLALSRIVGAKSATGLLIMAHGYASNYRAPEHGPPLASRHRLLHGVSNPKQTPAPPGTR
jgi:hypothetical protein